MRLLGMRVYEALPREGRKTQEEVKKAKQSLPCCELSADQA